LCVCIELVPLQSILISAERSLPCVRRFRNKRPSRSLHLAAGATALPAMSAIARAQAYPARPVRIIVGFVAGGSGDIVARLMGQWLSERLDQQFIAVDPAGRLLKQGATIDAEVLRIEKRTSEPQ
jgi:hypothetical protein